MFNPKGKKLADVKPADINKKAISKLGKKYNAETGKKAPFFINLEHKFSTGATDHLFVFGKLNAFKAEIKETVAKNQTTCVRGLCYVEYDDKKVPTLVFCPVKGKLFAKEALVTKAMKKTFTPAFANFKVGAEIDEKAAEAAEAAAELETEEPEDETEGTETNVVAEEAPKQTPQVGVLGGYWKRIQVSYAEFQKTKSKELALKLKEEGTTFFESFGKALPEEKTQFQKPFDTVSSIFKLLKIAVPGAETPVSGTETPERTTAREQNKQLKAKIDELLKSVSVEMLTKMAAAAQAAAK